MRRPQSLRWSAPGHPAKPEACPDATVAPARAGLPVAHVPPADTKALHTKVWSFGNDWLFSKIYDDGASKTVQNTIKDNKYTLELQLSPLGVLLVFANDRAGLRSFLIAIIPRKGSRNKLLPKPPPESAPESAPTATIPDQLQAIEQEEEDIYKESMQGLDLRA